MINKIFRLLFKRKISRRKITKSFNTLQSKTDPRDYHPIFTKSAISPSKYKIHSLPPIRHQSSIGSCASHAVIRAYEIQDSIQNNYMEGSELFHYYIARTEINNTFPKDNGMSIRDSCKAIKLYGMALETFWKYDVKKYNTKPNWISYFVAGFNKVNKYERLFTIEEIKSSLKRNVPVICGVWVDDEYFKLSKNNYIWIPKGIKRGGHAQTIVGYNDETKRLIIDNSWGKSWGLNGEYEISYLDFKKISFDWFRIIIN